MKLVWLSSVFLLVGGSQRVAKGMTLEDCLKSSCEVDVPGRCFPTHFSSLDDGMLIFEQFLGMNFTIVADTVDKSHRLVHYARKDNYSSLNFIRTRYMYILAGIPHITTLLAPPLSGFLMTTKIWVPFAVSIGALTLSLVIVLFMPESLAHRSPSNSVKDQESPLLGPADTLTPEESQQEAPSSPEQLPCGIHDRLPGPDSQTKEWWRDIVILLQMPGLPFCYLLFFFKPLAMISKAFVYQYASYNLDWGLSQTTWLRFAQAGGSFLATIAVLPLLSSVLNRRGLQAQILDLNVIRVSLLIAAIGFILLQFSYHSWMLLLGETTIRTDFASTSLLYLQHCSFAA